MSISVLPQDVPKRGGSHQCTESNSISSCTWFSNYCMLAS